MTAPRQCPQCGSGLPADTSAGSLCPKCLLELRLPSRDGEATVTAVTQVQHGVGDHIGAYKILEELGAGGMGVVYLAQQEQPVRRRVALKLIKWGMDTERVVGRFESERQALALMNHPNIARVYDGGATDRGRPYFVMEYVKGVPITEHCDRHRLNVRERLELFMHVCEGVQHAHQKGVIHRDIKPSNVLVRIQDDRAVPKIIDFGVAKATSQRLTEHTVYTELGQLVGTPEYMSPEQAEMTSQDIDTRTDVYALGVLLYELLAGALPFSSKELRKANFDEVRRRIREDEPSKPSTRLSTLGEGESAEAARRRRTELSALRKQLRGDLDWITMRALEKDRTRRYASPSELAADVGRHLRYEPVVASPPSTVYRTHKFVLRHRVGVAFAAAALISLLGFAVWERLQARRIAAERDRANQQAETAKQVSDFLVNIFEVSDPGEARGNTITAREVLDRGADKIAEELDDQPLVQARLMDAMGRVYKSLGLYDAAGELFRDALRIGEDELGPNHHDVVESLNNLGSVLVWQGNSPEALGYLERALAIGEAADSGSSLQLGWTLYHLGVMRAMSGEFEPALGYYERALPIFIKEEGEESQAVAWCLNDLGSIYTLTGDSELAIQYLEQSLALKRRILGTDHYDVAATMDNLGFLLMESGDYAKARPLIEEALAIKERMLGKDHLKVAVNLNNLGELYRRTGELDKARSVLERALSIREAILVPDSRELTVDLQSLALLYRDIGEYQQAEALFRRVLAIREGLPCKRELAEALEGYAALLRKTDRRDEAEKLEAQAADARANSLATLSTE